MEVKDANAALLSNFEVFQLLTDLKQQRKESGKSKQSSGQQNLNTIMYETLKYISKTPCRYQSPETVREFLAAMKGHKLTKLQYRTHCWSGCLWCPKIEVLAAVTELIVLCWQIVQFL
ncbi:DNA-directed RNA polymerase III subunit RPC9 isoform X2 [Tympanuchus pallidicinctus]|uniref:DNA-directed RNA polymerase III subunit RPC9 isoform X2 n=1 Tax=Tympanuchus pallidicinctus TaxID=109042 RepID=UPI002286ECC9|nr:DNA-directed RNA polymerase III subunit RPC9 isoform X2 [Tympanuchus pallidicinctus]